MIRITFLGENDNQGFEIKGHSGYSQEGTDIICASVSSAAYMTANTITEVLNVNPVDVCVSDGEMRLELSQSDAIKCADIISGFKLHIMELANQYPQFITVTEN